VIREGNPKIKSKCKEETNILALTAVKRFEVVIVKLRFAPIDDTEGVPRWTSETLGWLVIAAGDCGAVYK